MSFLALFLLASLGLASASHAAERPLLVGMGDSIGEGVLSAEADARTQHSSFIYLIARQMGAEMPLPLIRSWPLGSVFDETKLRRRIDPSVSGLNLAISGADVADAVRRRANATTPEEIDSETDLVLFPRRASQLEIVEALRPQFVVCWIGSNDVLAAATSFDELDASQMTSVSSFAASFHELASRLEATGAKVVFGNVPDVTSIAFIMDGEDLRRFAGDDFGLAPGSYTSLPALILLRLHLAGPRLLDNPDFVLDPSEVQRIQERVTAFNAIIEEESSRIGAALVDVNAVLGFFSRRELKLLGVPIGGGYLAGTFSLDAVHPSPLAHNALALLFLSRMNARFGTDYPLPSIAQLVRAIRNEPFADRDGDLRVRGIPLNGALETFGPLLGLSGDFDDGRAGRRLASDPERGRRFMRAFRERKGVSSSELDRWTLRDAVEALRELFALRQPQR